MPSSHLILFDIDATLLVTSGVGVAAMHDAGRALFGNHFTIADQDFAGRLDPLIIDELLARNGLTPSPELRNSFRRAYHDHLHARSSAGPLGRTLPGVTELLARLRSDARLIGLLTGNFAETGRMKLQSCGIDPDWFSPAVWGDHSRHAPPRREHLADVALQLAAATFGRPFRGEDLTIIGDTPHDVACARAVNARCIAVATGRYSIDQLLAAGACHALADLSDVNAVLDLLDGRSLPAPAAS